MTIENIQRKVFAVAMLAAATMFSLPAARAATFVVTNTNVSGFGSFRDAIDLSNHNLGTDDIQFAIPGAGTQTILLQVGPGDRINITDSVYINGWSQGGDPLQGPPLVELRCSGSAPCLNFVSD